MSFSYIRYVSKYVKALLAVGCHIILVFDGQTLPAKNVSVTCSYNMIKSLQK